MPENLSGCLSLVREDVCEILVRRRLRLVLRRAHERLGVELAYPLAGGLRALFVRVGEDVEWARDRIELAQLLPAHAGPADGDGALADCREGQSIHDALGDEGAGARRRGDKQWPVPTRELFGLRVEVLRLPLELAANEPLH